jgi:hypothetical protein
MKYSAFALLLAAHGFAAESGLPDFLPPGTKVMFGVQVQRILNSSLAQGVTPGAAAGALPGALPGGASLGADWQKIVALTGFDPFKDIDEVLIASAAEGQSPPMLVIALGKFNLERFSANASPYHSVPVLTTAKSSTGTVALLDASTAILGDLAEVHAAIDRRGPRGQLGPALAARVNDLRARYDIWGFGNGIANLMPPSPQPSGMDSIDRFQFGISITHGLELAGEVHARSLKDAQQLKQAAQFLELMMKSQPGGDSAKLDIHEDHGTLKLALTISEEELKKAVEAQRAALAARKAPGGGVKITTSTPQAKPGYNGPNVFTLPGK